MNKDYHILNGDALKSQFPPDILGKKIIARLCLVDGPVEAVSLEELFEIRATFIGENYLGFSKKDYLNNIDSEIQKIKRIPENATINFWFEDDLFCQVNFWFMLFFISTNHKEYKLNLVRPKEHSEYAFGGMNEQELIQVFENKTEITIQEQKILVQFWSLYQKNNITQLLSMAEELNTKFPFLIPAIRAHQDRLSNPGRPKKAIIRIMKELNTDKFELVFRAFCQQENIYGFGDLQVKRLFDEIIAEQKKD
jgi:hypothetical protein